MQPLCRIYLISACSIVALLSTTCLTAAQNITSVSDDSQYNLDAFDPPKMSLPAARVAAQAVRAQSARTSAVTEAPRDKANPTSMQTLLRTKRIIERYDSKMRSNNLTAKIMFANNLVVSAAVGAGVAAAGGGLVAGAFVLFTQTALSELTNTVKAEGDRNAAIALGAAVNAYVMERGLSDLEGAKNPAEFLQLLEKGGHPALDPSLHSLDDPLALGLTQSALIRVLGNVDLALSSEIERLAATTASKEEVAAAQRQLRQVGLAQKDIYNRINAGFGELSDQMNAVTKDIGELKARIQSNTNDIKANTRDINFLQDALYGGMSGADQAAWIRSGAMDSRWNETQIKQNLELAEMAKRREALVNSLNKYAKGANDALTIARNLGVPVPREVADFAQKSSAIAIAAITFTGADYLGGIAAISSLFGGDGGPDPTEARHRQVMAEFAEVKKALDIIQTGQQEIKQAINDMYFALSQNVKSIMENQAALYEAVRSVSEQLATSTDFLSQKIDRAGRIGIVTLQATVAFQRLDLLQCGEFSRSRIKPINVDGTVIVPFLNDEFVSYNALAAHYAQYRSFLWDCLNSLRRNMTGIGNTGSLFDLRLYEGDSTAAPTGDVDAYVTRVYPATAKSAIDYMRRFVGEHELPAKAWAALLVPSITIDEMQAKLERLKDTATPLPERLNAFLATINGRNAIDLIENPVIQTSLVETLEWLLDVYWYLDLTKEADGRRMLTPSELLAVREPSAIGRFILERGLALSEIAVAQTTLLNGDVAAAAMWDNLGGVMPNAQEQQQLALGANGVLAANTVIYGLVQRDTVGGVRRDPSGALYYVALASPDKQLLEAIFGSDWSFERGPDGWTAAVAGVRAPLPTPERFARGEFIISPELKNLLAVRAKLLDAYLGYEVIAGTEEAADRAALGQILLAGP